MDTCIGMAESLCCAPETITTLLIGYIPIQNKKLKKKSVANKLISHVYVIELPEKPKQWGSERFQVGARRAVPLTRTRKLCTPSHVPRPVHPFHSALPELHLS